MFLWALTLEPLPAYSSLPHLFLSKIRLFLARWVKTSLFHWLDVIAQITPFTQKARTVSLADRCALWPPQQNIIVGTQLSFFPSLSYSVYHHHVISQQSCYMIFQHLLNILSPAWAPSVAALWLMNSSADSEQENNLLALYEGTPGHLYRLLKLLRKTLVMDWYQSWCDQWSLLHLSEDAHSMKQQKHWYEWKLMRSTTKKKYSEPIQSFPVYVFYD